MRSFVHCCLVVLLIGLWCWSVVHTCCHPTGSSCFDSVYFIGGRAWFQVLALANPCERPNLAMLAGSPTSYQKVPLAILLPAPHVNGFVLLWALLMVSRGRVFVLVFLLHGLKGSQKAHILRHTLVCGLLLRGEAPGNRACPTARTRRIA